MKELGREPLFLLGLGIKVVCLFFFGSSYLRNLFVPFVDAVLLDPWHNPWARFDTVHFPYGVVLLAVLLVPKAVGYLLFGAASLGSGPLGLALIKLPLLVFDLWLLRLLVEALPGRRETLLWWYWLNPVAFYISYVHGQLDVVVSALTVQALLLLGDRRVVASGLALAAAALCKFHVLLVVPLGVAWLLRAEFRDRSWRMVAAWLVAFTGPVLLGLMPHALAGAAGYVTLGSPEAARLLSARIGYGEAAELYVGLLLVLAVLGRLMLSSWFSRDGLVLGVGAAWLSLLVATDPMPGWAWWPLPMLAWFHAGWPAAPRSVAGFGLVAYFAHFVAGEAWLGPTLGGLTLTALHASLLGELAVWFTFGLAREASLERRTRPLLVGVAGDSGSGKSWLARTLVDLFGADSTTVVAGDDYHRWERGHQKWEELTHLDPVANDLSTFAEHLRQMARGRAVSAARYDHGSGRFTDPRELRPGSTVIVEGLHALYYRGVRGTLDLAVFLATEPALRAAWKASRDQAERGHTRGTGDEVARRRESDAARHVEPQAALADWVIAWFRAADDTIGVRHLLWNDAEVARLVSALAVAPGLAVRIDRGIDRMEVEITGRMSEAEVEAVAVELYPDLRRVVVGSQRPRWRAGLDGVNQLLAVALLRERAELEGRPPRRGPG